ncbi:MAG: hypothetical protein JWN93_2792 [Hyphomicrobiales bacterium]|nr:hypothetical protein [Hyphomicrobiales bacterium]
MRLALFAFSLVSAGAASGAQAADWYTGAPTSGRSGVSSQPVAALDFSLSGTTQQSIHGVMIGTFAPFTGLEETGFRVRASALLGGYSYTSKVVGVGVVHGDQVGGALLGGYEWVTKTAKLTGWLGVDFGSNKFDKVDPDNKTAGGSFGARIGADFYVNPTSYTMLAGNLSFSSANSAYFSRFKAGMAVTQNVFLGPELQVLGDSFYSQYRFGLHVTGVKFGPVQFGLSGGYLSDRVRGSGGYGTFDTRIVF